MNPTKRLKTLCKELGAKYRIAVIDLEPVIYRDFHNGFDVEVSGLNHNSTKLKADIYIWKDKAQIVGRLCGVEPERIDEAVETLYSRVAG